MRKVENLIGSILIYNSRAKVFEVIYLYLTILSTAEVYRQRGIGSERRPRNTCEIK